MLSVPANSETCAFLTRVSSIAPSMVSLVHRIPTSCAQFLQDFVDWERQTHFHSIMKWNIIQIIQLTLKMINL